MASWEVLETANIKLASVASDVFGVSGRRMLRARLDGVSTPQEMAELAKGTLRKKMAALAAALEGRVEDHHRFLLGMQLDRLEQVETAAVVLAELGVDMGVFPTVHHAAAWAGVCPGNNESAGKRKVNRGAKVTFIGPPHSYKLPYVRRERRAAISGKSTGASKHVAGPCERHWRSPTRSWWPLITCFRTDWTNNDLGAGYLDRISVAVVKASLVKRLERLGYRVALEPVAT